MTAYKDLSKEELLELKNGLEAQFAEIKAKGLKLDMSRGKPSTEQLNLSMGMMDVLNSSADLTCEDGVDCRNYGGLDGITEAKQLLADMMEVPRDNVIIFGNSSLNVMYDTVARAMTHGIMGSTPWCKLDKVKFLCPVPGYDRHFSVTELFGIEMINVPMLADGPDMDKVEELIKDPGVKGMWNVPKYSNPTGVIYSDVVVDRLAKMRPAAKDFMLMWDNAYMVHALYGQEEQANIMDLAKKYGNEDMIYGFGSTSKITFAGAGVSFIYSSKKNIAAIKKFMNIQSIGPDKLSQLAHYRYLKSVAGIYELMEKHAELLRPKFEAVAEVLEEELGGTGIATWTKPTGGYFISVDLYEGTAKRTVELARQMGVVFTGAGATYPYKRDPKDSNVRIAPSLPPISELIEATKIFATAAKIAYLEKQV